MNRYWIGVRQILTNAYQDGLRGHDAAHRAADNILTEFESTNLKFACHYGLAAIHGAIYTHDVYHNYAGTPQEITGLITHNLSKLKRMEGSVLRLTQRGVWDIKNGG